MKLSGRVFVWNAQSPEFHPEQNREEERNWACSSGVECFPTVQNPGFPVQYCRKRRKEGAGRRGDKGKRRDGEEEEKGEGKEEK